MIVGSGVDVIEIARIERALARRGARFERRVFTPDEIRACRRSRRSAAHFAVRFAAKEAAMKACGTGWARGVRWVDFETRISATGTRDSRSSRLELVLHGRAREIANELGTGRTHVAVSRSRTHALAVVLLEEARC